MAVGLVAHEYGYTLEYIMGLTPFQISYLVSVVGWIAKLKRDRVDDGH